MHHRIIQDNFRYHYRLHLPGDPLVPAAIEPKDFWDPVITETFVRHLRVPTDFWLRILSRFPAAPYDPNATVEGRISHSLLRGYIKLYPVSHLDRPRRGHTADPYPVITGEQGLTYQLAPASVLLVTPPPTIKSFGNKAEAAAFLTGLNLDQTQLRGLVRNLSLWVEQTDLSASVSQALVEGKLLVIVHQPSVIPPASADSASSSSASSTNKPVSLGPHAEGLHNQDWDDVEVKAHSFKTMRTVDMAELSAEDKQTVKALEHQGWEDDQIEKVLKSGDGFKTKELQPGDKLYGFDSQHSKYGLKKQDSPYWLDEAGYRDAKAKYYRDGQWDKEGVKNYLALPCMNRADVVDVKHVTEPTMALESSIVKAREQIAYTNADYTTGMLGKIMPGGGKQITPAPNATSAVTRFKGTP